METFKKIVNHIRGNGHVTEFTTQLEVVAYFDTPLVQYICLGLNKQIYLQIPANEIDQRGLEFNYYYEGEY